jgi:excisionase family DNA binding protein
LNLLYSGEGNERRKADEFPATTGKSLKLRAKPRYIQDYRQRCRKTLSGIQPFEESIMRSSAVRSNLLVPMVREVMDIRQASDYLGISPDTLYKYASEGFVPAFKLGNRWRFKRSRMDEWMDRQSDMQAGEVDPEMKKPVVKQGIGIRE